MKRRLNEPVSLQSTIHTLGTVIPSFTLNVLPAHQPLSNSILVSLARLARLVKLKQCGCHRMTRRPELDDALWHLDPLYGLVRENGMPTLFSWSWASLEWLISVQPLTADSDAAKARTNATGVFTAADLRSGLLCRNRRELQLFGNSASYDATCATVTVRIMANELRLKVSIFLNNWKKIASCFPSSTKNVPEPKTKKKQKKHNIMQQWFTQIGLVDLSKITSHYCIKN